MTAHIVVEDLRKTFSVRERSAGLVGALGSLVSARTRDVQALAGIDFEIERGELVAYVGPNGAGKSTTVKVLSGILTPTSGRCVVDGRVPWRERIAHVARIGVVFGQRTQLLWDLPLADSLELLRVVYAVDEAAFRRRAEELVELLALGPLLATPVRQLSLGERMRGELLASLCHAPSILFLDEPTIGLDAPSKLAVRRFVRQLNREHGVTVLLTTHDFDDIEAVCERVIVIANGCIVRDGSLDDLRRSVLQERHLVVDSSDDAEVVLEGARLIERNGRRHSFAFDPREVTPADLIRELYQRYRVSDLFIAHPPIEEVVAELYRRAGEAP